MANLTDEYGRRPRTFRSTVARPDGITTTVTIRVPAAVAWNEEASLRELSELAAMGAARTATAVDKTKAHDEERCPF